jgi:hypothetical protein
VTWLVTLPIRFAQNLINLLDSVIHQILCWDSITVGKHIRLCERMIGSHYLGIEKV